MNALQRRTRTLPRRRCVLLEWVDPLFRSGHWGPDLVAVAGGVDPVGVAGANAATVEWDAIHAAQPEVLILACCGYGIQRTLDDRPLLEAQPGWRDLPAVKNREVWVLDGSAYVSRPGPRLVESAELIAQCLHPKELGEPEPPHAVRAS